MGARRDLDRRGLRDRVYDLVFEMLLTGDLPPGSRLGIDTLARDLGVSPTPVREALVHLERTGLVTREALKGYRVAPPLDAAQLAELFDARVVLETGAARLAAARADTLVPTLRRLQARHEQEGEHVIALLGGAERVPLEAMQAYFAADGAFHQAIFAASQNRYLIDMYDDLGAVTHRLRQVALRGLTDVKEAGAEHRAVVEAFESGDPAAPVAAMRRHIANVRARSLGGL
ncbi:GntR family transcriptional regulator [Agilicoccus flavus]|uniref:GntR family transcriptional regulator n=1 Tax=Agilicoccus flavus TaxID=2775968 RepID=UPI001CF66F8B|nr:GntR family transcriptional regulator [Agilicoccus flavus]